MKESETKLKTVTDFIVWLAFTSTLLATVALLSVGTFQLIQGESGWQLVGASIVTLGMHWGVRYLPTQGH